jgi:hypothetical protein
MNRTRRHILLDRIQTVFCLAMIPTMFFCLLMEWFTAFIIIFAVSFFIICSSIKHSGAL